MNLFIDLHAIASVVAFALMAVFCVVWALYSRSIGGLFVAVGASLTVFVASRSDLILTHMLAIFVVGAILTALLTVMYLLVRANLTSRRSRPSRYAQREREQTVLQFTGREPVSQSRQSGKVRFVPVPEPEAREYPEYGREYAEYEYEEPRRAPVRHSGAKRSASRGGYKVNQRPEREYSRARNARLQD